MLSFCKTYKQLHRVLRFPLSGLKFKVTSKKLVTFFNVKIEKYDNLTYF